VISEKDIFPLRPYDPDGYHPYEKELLIGTTLTRTVKGDDMVTKGDLKL